MPPYKSPWNDKNRNKLFDEEYSKMVKTQIQNCMANGEADALKNATIQNPVLLEDVLGATDDKYWWQLYINPMDWASASHWAIGNKDHPGSCYDSERETGKTFQPNMVKVIDKYFIKDELKNYLTAGSSPLTSTVYNELWKAVLAKSEDAAKARTTGPAPGSLADDVWTTRIGYEKTFEIPGFRENVVWKNPSLVVDDDPNEISPNTLALHVGSALSCILLPTEPTLKKGEEKYQEAIKETIPQVIDGVLDEIFLAFSSEVGDVKPGDPAQPVLRSIVRMLRTIHIIHPKGDGMGRTNWGTLLPLVLAKYGFGLPLGGKYKVPDNKIGSDFKDITTPQDLCIDRGAMNFMFSGGYTIDEITNFLWLMQDYGLLAGSRGEATALFAHPASWYLTQ